jgi:hypothetical protein
LQLALPSGWFDDPDAAWNDAGSVAVNRSGQTLVYVITDLGGEINGIGDSRPRRRRSGNEQPQIVVYFRTS